MLCAAFAQAVGFARLRGGSDASWRGAFGSAQDGLPSIAAEQLETFRNKKPGIEVFDHSIQRPQIEGCWRMPRVRVARLRRRHGSLTMILVQVFSVPAQAAAADRYCLRGRHAGFPGNCQFATRAQCLAIASGTSAYCGINPRYASSRRRLLFLR